MRGGGGRMKRRGGGGWGSEAVGLRLLYCTALCRGMLVKIFLTFHIDNLVRSSTATLSVSLSLFLSTCLHVYIASYLSPQVAGDH